MKPARSSRVRARDLTLKKDAPTAPSSSPPDSKPPKPKVRLAHLRQYWAWLKPYWRQLLGLFALALLAAGLDLVWPLLIKAMVDRLGSGGDAATATSQGEKLRWLLLFSAAIIVLLIIKQSVELFRSVRTSVLNAKLLFRLRRRLFSRLLHLPLQRLGEFKTGGVVSRLSSDVDQVGGLVQQALIAPGVAVLRIVLTVVVLLYLSPQLALVTLGILPIVGLLTLLWLRRVRPVYRSMMEDRSSLDARVGETFGGIRVVRAFRRESREGLEYAVGAHTVIRKMLRANRAEFTLENVWGLLIPLASLLVVAYGSYLVIQGRGKLGDVFAFQIYAVLLFGPVMQIVSSISQTQKSLAAMERVFDTLAEPPDKPDRPGALDAPANFTRLRLDHASFEYRPGVPVLRDIDLNVPAGSTVALVGPSGAGKTTLTDLICRFHDPTSGRLLLDEIDLRDLKLDSYRRLLAVVQQDTFLFDGTVVENIAYGRRGASLDAIIEAARRANAHGFISDLPERYDTQIGERGFKLSGGQRQRISIARAMLADPRILILDEATSSLDTESEQLIQAALKDLLRGRTTFVIAHRLSTIQNADLIVVLEAGQIVETGRHEELLARGGTYHDMVQRQKLAMESEALASHQQTLERT